MLFILIIGEKNHGKFNILTISVLKFILDGFKVYLLLLRPFLIGISREILKL